MTIAAYTGLPGHGKSYGVVENVIVPALKAKREVFTNIPMNVEECLKRFHMAPFQFDMQDILDNPNWWTEVFRPGAVIVLDELWRLWPSGLKANNVRDQDKSFLAEHRHMVGENGQSVEIIFVTQDLSQIASFARALVENTFRVTKLSKLGLDKSYRVDVYFGPVTGNSPPVSKRDREILGKFKKDIYALYKSHTKSVTGAAGNEKRVDGRYSVLGRVSIKLGFVAAIISLGVFWYGVKHLTAYYGLSKPKSNQAAETQAGRVQSTAAIAQPVPKKPTFQFLSKAESLFFTGKIGASHNGKMITDYNFEATFDESYVSLTDKDLYKLGYKVKIINDCMALVSGEDFNGYALCRLPEVNKGWVASAVESPQETM